MIPQNTPTPKGPLPGASSFRPLVVARRLTALLLLGATAVPGLHATVHTLGDTTTASPITVAFDDATGRMTVTVKSNGTVWNQGTAGGGSTWASPSGWTNPTDLTASGNATLNTYPVTVSLEIITATGELKVTIGGSATQSITNTIIYPYPFFKSDGSGYAVLPYFGGFLVPTTGTAWSEPWSHARMEWLGGTDSSRNEGWMAIADPADDMLLRKQTSTVAGVSRVGGAFQWKGSNANASLLSNRLSYNRTATFTFFTSGGYVAQAKKFRDFAITKGWHKSLTQKTTTNSNVTKLLGAPLIYLWGDGRSQTMLDALDAAGINKALILFSINHVDHNNAYPASTWGSAVAAKGWVSGIYDIYSRYNSVQTTPPLNGFYYLWPTTANPNWLYITSGGTASALDVAHSKSYTFARDTRLPAHIANFGLDGFFFDTTCALEPYEDYGTLYGYDHSASRAQDIGYRQALLAASSGASPNHNKLTGTEMAKSWAIPHIHWAEGQFRNGHWGTPGQYNNWDNNAYPTVMTDVTPPVVTVNGVTTDYEPQVLSSGYQVPLFELVYHDTIVSTQHWHTTHNKLLYAWDLSDRNALIRGQAPIFNLVYDGAPGTIGGPVATVTDAVTGLSWNTKWTNPNVPTRVMQTYNTVCTWHEIVGDLPMYDHKILTSDASNNYIVQNSEFSGDGGVSGHGIVVNFGTYDGNHGMTNGSTWTGTIRGNNLTVAVGAYSTYSWGAGDTTPPTVSITAPTNGATVSGTIAVSATASDNVGVVGVQFKLDGANLGAEDTTSPYSINWDTTTATAGAHSLTAVARDAAGNSTTSTTVSVTVNNSAPTTVTFESVATEDGWVLESSETSGTGGSNNSNNTTLRIGDDASRKQYKLVVSFDTSSIPDGATITAATLKLTRSTVTGNNPFTWSGNTCTVDIRNGGFNGNTSLENTDFQAAATATQVATMSSPPSNNSQSTGALNSSGLSAINKTGKTQLRVYFTQDDNNNGSADYVQIYSSNYNTDTSRRPKLEITYQ